MSMDALSVEELVPVTCRWRQIRARVIAAPLCIPAQPPKSLFALPDRQRFRRFCPLEPSRNIVERICVSNSQISLNSTQCFYSVSVLLQNFSRILNLFQKHFLTSFKTRLAVSTKNQSFPELPHSFLCTNCFSQNFHVDAQQPLKTINKASYQAVFQQKQQLIVPFGDRRQVDFRVVREEVCPGNSALDLARCEHQFETSFCLHSLLVLAC